MQYGCLRNDTPYGIIQTMKTHTTQTCAWIAALLAALALLSGCGLRNAPQPDPHQNQIQVYDGSGTVWVTPWKDVAPSDWTQDEFRLNDDGSVDYTGTRYCMQQGVDVSYFQGEIDWNAVAAAGVEFAYIRAGYRGYVDGGIYADERFEQNAAGALAAGLEVGVYFFSQAVTPEEAAEEARWLLEHTSGYDMTLPYAFDWEAQVAQDDDPVRTEGMLGAEMTACAVAFCDEIRAAGKTPAVYANRWQGYYDYDLSQLTGAELWISAPGDRDDFYYAHSIWQYSYTGTVPGISASVDRNLRFLPITEER